MDVRVDECSFRDIVCVEMLSKQPRTQSKLLRRVLEQVLGGRSIGRTRKLPVKEHTASLLLAEDPLLFQVLLLLPCVHSLLLSAPIMPNYSLDESIAIIREYYTKRGYLVYSGLQFGVALVLYADQPDRVHSDFAVHVVSTALDWRTIQSLVRLMPALHKTLILAQVREDGSVHEIAMTNEHAPFRHHRERKAVGAQRKRAKVEASVQDTTTSNEVED